MTFVDYGAPKKKRRKKTPRASASARCDTLFSELIRARGVCELQATKTCSGSARLQCCHGISRRYKATRWDTRNAYAGCAACHVYFTHHPLEWDAWLLERQGTTLYYELRDLALRGKKWTQTELEELAAWLRTMLETP